MKISRLVELAYPDDPPVILDRTSRDFFIGSLTPLTLREKVLDLGPNTLDEALAAAQRYESNQKVLNKGSTHVLTSTAEEKGGGNATSHRGTPEPPVWAQQLFQQQAEILEKLKSIPQGRPGRNETVESPQGPRACFKCGSLNHFIRNCPPSSSCRPGKLETGWAQPEVTPPGKSKGAFMPCSVDGVLSHALLDTGAEATIISDDIYHCIGL